MAPVAPNRTLVSGDDHTQAAITSYKKGVKVWIRDPQEVWITATLQEDIAQEGVAASQITVELQDGRTKSLPVKTLEDLPFLRNPDILIGRDDLTTLSYLHEPAVLFNLCYRFLEQEAIYTYCGIVLVAINPYQDCSHLYGKEMIQVYRGVGKQVRELDPHIYAVAEEAYYDLKEFHKNQSLIVSGESGAGKTVSAKFAMRYFASVSVGRSGGRSEHSPGMNIEERVLASNPIMEAIGNAKTIRNDNSSRFGKFIQIDFSEKFGIAGATMKTYLLEKSRVVFQADRERNYHVFYQMCASRSTLKGLHLQEPSHFHYIRQGGDWHIPSMDDGSEFKETLRAFETLGIAENERDGIFRVLAGILYLGNVKFDGAGSADPGILAKEADSTIKLVCGELLKLDEQEFRMWLVKKDIQAGNEIVRRHLSFSQAVASRDAFSKMLYAALFNWIVTRINGCLAKISSPTKKWNSPKSPGMVSHAKQQNTQELGRFIGVLDIYGFETFLCNSFEQFCINYANEKLQQQFNLHVFKLEQEEYEREGIEWVRIKFYDNQPCIDLIEDKLGLIDMLDEQCKVGRGTDTDWLEELRASKRAGSLKTKEDLQFPRIRQPVFIVRHFAADVTYQVDGFLEKNADSVSEQLVEVFRNSKFDFLRHILTENQLHELTTSEDTKSAMGQRPRAGSKNQYKRTVASQFRDSLKDLMGILMTTRPHFVRCIKPNDEKAAFTFHSQRAIEQLRACGVLETVRISAAGYPSRWAYDEFGKRYRVLYPCAKPIWRDRPKEFAQSACEKWIEDHTKFALGKTKVFFRTGQVAYLERLRTEILSAAALTVQKIWRGYHARKRYEKIKGAILTIQTVGRAFLAWRRLHYLQMHRAAVKIQSTWKRFVARRRFMQIRTTVLAIQCRARGRVVREQICQLRFEKLVVNLQKHARGYLSRKRTGNFRKKLILAQSCVRRWLAKRRLKELKIEARSVRHLQNLNKGLENKIISLQQKVDNLALENQNLSGEARCLPELQKRVRTLENVEAEFGLAQARMAGLEAQLKELNNLCKHLEREKKEMEEKLKNVDIELAEEWNARQELSASLEAERLEAKKRIKELNAVKEELQENLRNAEERAETMGVELERLREVQDSLLEKETLQASSIYNTPPGSVQSDSQIPADRRQGFGRTHSTASTVQLVPEEQETSVKTDEIPLILRQQAMITDLKTEKDTLESELQKIRSYAGMKEIMDKMSVNGSIMEYERQKSQELEVANLKLRNELDRIITERYQEGPEKMDFKRLLDSYVDEIERRRDESVELRALLAAKFDKKSPKKKKENQTPEAEKNGGGPFASWGRTLGWKMKQRVAEEERREERVGQGVMEELEKELCWERQAREQKHMIEDLMHQREGRDRIISDLRAEIQKFNESRNERHALIQNFVNDGLSQFDSLMQNELGRIATENLLLHGKLERAASDSRVETKMMNGSATSNALDVSLVGEETMRLRTISKEFIEHSALLEIRDVAAFVRILVPDLKPRIAALITPGLPAYLFLLAFRYYDHAEDEASLSALFTAVHGSIRSTVDGSHDLDVLGLWFVNCWRLLNLLRQYSSEEEPVEWFAQNSSKQNEQKLKRFDLRPVREKIVLRVDDAYRNFMKRAIEPVLSPKVVPAILQHESAQLEILGLLNGKNKKTSDDRQSERALSDLIEFLNFVHAKLCAFGADWVLLSQVFGQMTSWICALALNHLMFRKELCNFDRAFQIKHNTMEVMEWLDKKKLSHLKDRMEPLIQASHLLQSRKDDQYVESLCGDLTSRLKPKQIMTLLQHYIPADGIEARLPAEFLQKVSDELERTRTEEGTEEEGRRNPLMMQTYLTPIDASPFVYSDVALERIVLPSCLKLSEAVRLL